MLSYDLSIDLEDPGLVHCRLDEQEIGLRIPRLREGFAEIRAAALELGAHTLAVDFAKVGLVDSTGFGALVRCLAGVGGADGDPHRAVESALALRVILCNLPPAIRLVAERGFGGLFGFQAGAEAVTP